MGFQNEVKVRHSELGVETVLPADAVPQWRRAGWDPVDEDQAAELVEGDAPRAGEERVTPIREAETATGDGGTVKATTAVKKASSKSSEAKE